MSRAVVVVSLALLAMGSAAASDSSDTSVQAVIEARQAGFKKMGAAMKSIAAELKTDAPDLTKMSAAAQAIALGVKEQPSWFPAGSGPESGLETDALAHIWKDSAKFAALSNQLGAESGNLATALASKDVAAVRTQFKVLADACSTCHKSFRAD
jgi:cytochrome c556